MTRIASLLAAGLATERDMEEAGESEVLKAKLDTETVWIRSTADNVEKVDERTLRFTWSTETKDRAGDRIRVAGWQTRNFSANPVALYMHDHERQVGRSPQHAKDLVQAKLWGDIEFPEEGTDAFIDSRFKLAAAGFLKATSVGFLALDPYVPKDKAERDALGLGRFGVEHRSQELLEISLVTVPMNPDALGASMRKCVDSGLLTEKEADAFGRETPLTERDWFARLQRIGKSTKSQVAVLHPEPTNTPEERFDRLERKVDALGDLLRGLKPDARRSDAEDGWNAGELLDLIGQRTAKVQAKGGNQ